MTRARPGMTLMELIVGLVITGVMAAAGTAAFGSIIDHRRVIQASTVEMERAAALREMLRLWIVSGTVAIQTGGVPRGMASSQLGSTSSSSSSGVTAAQATGDELTVTTSAPNPAMAPSVRIRIFIDADPGTPESGLTIEYQSNVDIGDLAAGGGGGNALLLHRRQLDADVGSMTVEFLDARTHRWFASTQAATISPSAVKVALFPRDGATLPAILQLPIIVTMLGGAQ